MSEAPRALAWLASCWIVGLLCANALAPGTWQSVLALGLFGVGALGGAWGFLQRERGELLGSSGRERVSALRIAPGLVALGACGAAFAAGLCCGGEAQPLRVPPAGMARVQAIVEETRVGGEVEPPASPEPSELSRSVIRVLSGVRLEDNAPLVPGTLLGAGPEPLPLGARVQLLVKVVPRLPFRNQTPHPRSPPRFELVGSAWIPDAHAVRVLEVSWFDAWLDAARTHVRARLVATLPPQAAGIARALVLGDDAAVSESDQDDVRGAGLLHVFAVSGLHVAILAGLCVALLERVLVRWTAVAARHDVRRIACALGAVLALAYADFAGGAPSAWRAAITAAVSWTLVAMARRPDPRSTTAISALVLGALDPGEAVRPAFLLSIAATAAIVGAPRLPAEDLSSFLHGLLGLSVRAWVATAPVVLWCFGGVPVLGVLANMVMLPFASFLLVQLSAAHALLATFTPFWHLSARIFSSVSAAFVTGCSVFSRLWPAVAWPPPDLWQGIVLAVTSLAWLLLERRRTRVVLGACALLVLGALELRLRHAELPTGKLRISFLDVGQGDAALIDLPDGRAMLIDAGGNPGGGPDPGRAVLLPLLAARRRARIDIAVLTHPHPDHFGGLAALIGQLPIGELWDSGQAEGERDLQPTSGQAAALLQAARANHTRVRAPAELSGHPLVAAGARVAVLAPCPRYDPGYDPNDNSLVLRIDYGQRSFLLVGDAESHAESVLLERGAALHADVLKVGHHGSRTSSSAAFLRAVAPKLALISAGAGNRFGHPHAEVMLRLHATVPAVLSSAEVGSTIVETDGRALRVRTWSGQQMRWW
jgi:competence protein ComEC